MAHRMNWLLIPLVVIACNRAEPANEAGSGAYAAFTTADSSAVMAVLDRLKAAGRANNWDAWTAEYVDDAIRLPPHEKALRGRAAIKAWNDAFPTVTAFDLTVDHLITHGQLAVVHGGFTLSAAASGSPAVIDEGKYITVMWKQSDGSWKIMRDMWNSDKPLPTQ